MSKRNSRSYERNVLQQFQKKLPNGQTGDSDGLESLYIVIFLAKKRGCLEAVVEALRLKKGESLRICTDGEKIYVDRFEEPIL